MSSKEKYLLLINIFIVIFVNGQNIKTYSGIYDLENQQEQGNAIYKYYENEKNERIYHGNFEYKRTANITEWTKETFGCVNCILKITIKGEFVNNLKNGLWIFEKSYGKYKATVYANYNNGYLNGECSYIVKDIITNKVIIKSNVSFINNIMINEFTFEYNRISFFVSHENSFKYCFIKINLNEIGQLNGNYTLKFTRDNILYLDEREYNNGVLKKELFKNTSNGKTYDSESINNDFKDTLFFYDNIYNHNILEAGGVNIGEDLNEIIHFWIGPVPSYNYKDDNLLYLFEKGSILYSENDYERIIKEKTKIINEIKTNELKNIDDLKEQTELTIKNISQIIKDFENLSMKYNENNNIKVRNFFENFKNRYYLDIKDFNTIENNDNALYYSSLKRFKALFENYLKEITIYNNWIIENKVFENNERKYKEYLINAKKIASPNKDYLITNSTFGRKLVSLLEFQMFYKPIQDENKFDIKKEVKILNEFNYTYKMKLDEIDVKYKDLINCYNLTQDSIKKIEISLNNLNEKLNDLNLYVNNNNLDKHTFKVFEIGTIILNFIKNEIEHPASIHLAYNKIDEELIFYTKLESIIKTKEKKFIKALKKALEKEINWKKQMDLFFVDYSN